MSILHLVPSVVSRTYGVMFKYDEELSIHYEITLSKVEAVGDGNFHFTLNKRQVYINNKAPELIADKLAEDLGKVIYPLILEIDKEGYIHSVFNADEIKSRWREERTTIERYYQGRIAKEALESMEIMVSDPARLSAGIQNDWFMALFFSGIYGLKAYDFREYTDLKLPMIPYATPVNYKITREITEQHTDSKCLVIECHGTIAEQRSLEDILLKNPAPVFRSIYGNSKEADGKVELKYRLYHNDFSVRAITGKSNIATQEKTEQNVIFEIYHLQEKDLPGAGE